MKRPPPTRRNWSGFLAQASTLLAAAADYETALVAVADQALPYFGSWCIVDVIELDGSMRRLAVLHPDPAQRERAARLQSSWPPERDDPLGAPRATRTRKSEVIPKVSDAFLTRVARSEQNLQDLRGLAIGSALVVPLIARDIVVGAITFVSAVTGHQYGEADLELAEDLASRCAFALDNARLLRDARSAGLTSARMNEKLVLASLREQDRADAATEARDIKASFLNSMSHELRTPLNAILGYAGLIEEGIAGPITVKQKEFLGRIRSSTAHLVGLISEVLDLAKLESGRMRVDREDESGGAVVEEAIALTRPMAEAAAVEIVPPSREALASLAYHGDAGRVLQILVNLLSNAVKFTNRAGRITLTVGRTGTPNVHAILPGDGPWAFIAVRDTGIGVDDDDAALVFQPFEQVLRGGDVERGGTGLGLTISRDFARRMDGDLTLESVTAHGSCFTLWLPVGPVTPSEA